jgi:hypothetical protein
MMKRKICLLLAVLAIMAMPLAASAAEFTLGGQIALYTVWDSTQTNGNLTNLINRNNDANFQHGRLKFSAEKSRMYFLIKGPQIWGAQTSGYIEWDFDNSMNVTTAAGSLGTSPQKARLALRHAFFRLNWPSVELLMGQYWSLLTEDIPDVANPGSDAGWGNPYFREPQIRVSYKTCGFDFALALSEPSNGQQGTTLDPSQSANNNIYDGESSETPRVTGRIKYEADFWGKAPYYGQPRGFSARLAGSWQRTRFRAFTDTQARTFNEDHWATITANQRDQQYLNNWIVEGSVFIPILCSSTPSPARTLSILAQWYVGAGLDNVADDYSANSSFLSWTGIGTNYDRELMKRYGGFVQGTYYFTNEWYLNLVWSMNKAFGVSRSLTGNEGSLNGFMPFFATIDASSDPAKMNQAYYATLYYRPIQALKFGLEYTYARTDFMQNQGVKTTAAIPGDGTATFYRNPTTVGENHRLLFVGYFYF